MLYVATILRPSGLHGYGCFCQEFVAKGKQVWSFDHKVDHILKCPWSATWEWAHAYRSKVEDRLILPRDNAAWINFSEQPSLIEGPPIIQGEPSLLAVRDLLHGDELTVGRETDLDAELKLSVQGYLAGSADVSPPPQPS